VFQVKDGTSIILASESSRRVDILRTLGISFSIIPPNIEEEQEKDESPGDFVSRMAYEKAHKVGLLFPETWVLGADTVVVLRNRILGKPTGNTDAFNMLKALRGKWHKVLTGYCILNITRNAVLRNVAETKVFIRDLTDEEIMRYVETLEPLDKAGSYAVQGKGGHMVKEIRGSYTNVVGLPICEVTEALLSLGVVS
jgi:septum formation protein